MSLRIAATVLPVLLSFQIAAQHQPVFPGLSGQVLLDSLSSAFKPVFSMPQAQARDTLFGVIDNHSDSLACVYTGFTIWLDPTQDPTQAAFMNNSPDAINTEHTYPQSLGASGLAEGDLHHLYPTRADANAARANSPFAEIPDDETEEWFFLDQKTSSIPASNLDMYSERKGDLFEPREDHKGNVARSMFYFYTMYKEQADMANNVFFETQRQTLCAWHLLDPVDQREWDRTWKIAEYQAQPNPFVLDCTLAERTFCNDFGEMCTPVVTASEVTAPPIFLFEIVPNPVGNSAVFHFSLSEAGSVRFDVFNLLGSSVGGVEMGWRENGKHQFYWTKNQAAGPGIYMVRLTLTPDGGQPVSVSKKMIVQP